MALPDPHKSRAVLVGIGDYTNADLTAIPAAATGADHMARLLRDPSIWGLPHKHVTVLGTATTQEQILTTVRDAALATEDTLVVYFAGHGLRDPGERLHLALVDADPDYPQIGTLPYRQLRDLIRQSGHRAKHRVTILDCCYSGIAGGMSHSTAPTRDELATALDERAHTKTAGDYEGQHESDEDGHGDCVLTSAPPQSRSFVRPGAPFPEFTGELIATLEAGITGVGAAISLEHVWLKARNRMRARDSPEPQLFTQNNSTRHIHFHNRAPHERQQPGPAAPGPDPGPDGKKRDKPRKKPKKPKPETPPQQATAFTVSWTGNEDPRTFTKNGLMIPGGLLLAVALAFFYSAIEGSAKSNPTIAYITSAVFLVAGILLCDNMIPPNKVKRLMQARTLSVDDTGLTTSDPFGNQHFSRTSIKKLSIHHTSEKINNRAPLALHLQLHRWSQEAHRTSWPPAGWPPEEDPPESFKRLPHTAPDKWVPVCLLGPLTRPNKTDLQNALALYLKKTPEGIW
ncbi:caspase domain-containing protein [Streptomyces sp. NPDC058576]|uniref:caspase family protein n=1 Tax=Streptomyces sp. NPDC058576 TaxID=3346547 RepID=UPI00365E3EBA